MNIQQTPLGFNSEQISDAYAESLLSTATEVTSDEQDWDEPEQIIDALVPVEELIPDLIPEPLRAYVLDEAGRMCCPPDYIFASLMVCIGAVIGTACGVRPKRHDSWTVVPNLWGAIIAKPGSMKTAALKAGTRFINELEQAAHQEFEQADRRYKAEYAAYKAEKESIETDMRNAAKSSKKSRYAANERNLSND